ncbi:hypothetical protein LTR08_006405 [Meristemomyces frigidus]|nr:hypothetical protein LTR08_006405 [Meristemomyces frigidus]
MLYYKPRRSTRLSAHDDPNGRVYLASLLSWPRHRLETWLTSPTVRPHLQLWYRLCISNSRRFNDAVEWINTGPKGYYFHTDDLEEDLLLMCLGEGNDGYDYVERKARTEWWITQEVWARTAWRIVQANAGEKEVFELMVEERPAGAYGFVIEVLCLAFHSIAHRGKGSCYVELINGGGCERAEEALQDETGMDDLVDDDDTESATTLSTVSDSTEMSDDSADLDFESKSSRTSVPRGAVAKRKRGAEDGGVGARAVEEWIALQDKLRKAEAEMDGEGVGSPVVKRCFSVSLADQGGSQTVDDNVSRMVDEDGVAVTRYRMTSEMHGRPGNGIEALEPREIDFNEVGLLDRRRLNYREDE